MTGSFVALGIILCQLQDSAGTEQWGNRRKNCGNPFFPGLNCIGFAVIGDNGNLSAANKGSFSMSIRKATMAALIAGSMVAVPTIAQAQATSQTAVSKLSVRSAQVRSGAVVAKKNDLGGGSLIIALLAAAAVVGGIVLAAGGGNNATSP